MKFHNRHSFPKLVLQVLALLVVLLPNVAKASLESEIQAFEAEDALRPPPPGATLFVGSSTFNSWPNLAASFPEHSVLNRGFGGSQMSDVLFYFDRVVARYRPPHIVVYEGDNDLAAGKSVSQVFNDYSNFLARVELQLPGTIIGFVSVKPSPSRAHLLTQMQQLNAQVRALAEARGHRYIDTHTPMLNTSGQPRPELFLSDMLHMNAAGYTLWTSIIEPVLDDWKAPMGGTFLFDLGAGGTGVGLGASPNDPVRYWNNVGAALTADTGSYSNAVTVQNVSSTMSLVVVSRFNGVNEAGTTVSTVYPLNATRDSLFGNTETFNNVSNIFPSFKLTGLDTQTVYSFSFYASRTGVGDVRETGYTVVGANQGFAALDAANNVDNTATVADITPTEAGEITISLAPTENNNNANHFTYLGVLRVDAVPPQTPLAFTLEPVTQRALELQPVTFSAAVSGPPPYQVQWLRNGEPIEGATQFNYTIASATLDLDGSLYSVSVSNRLWRDQQQRCCARGQRHHRAGSPHRHRAQPADDRTALQRNTRRLHGQRAVLLRSQRRHPGRDCRRVAARRADGGAEPQCRAGSRQPLHRRDQRRARPLPQHHRAQHHHHRHRARPGSAGPAHRLWRRQHHAQRCVA
ncbi:MAG: hypothetical protein IPK15_05435 [Verrucomicrobia bacterium]|nr:hypothetical protein [Verrucomicrobiota bacterium]